MLPEFPQNLTLQEAVETAAKINEELKRMEFDKTICKNFKLLIDGFSFFFFAKHWKSVEKMIYERKVGVTEHPRLLNPGKAIQCSNGHLPYLTSMTWRKNLRAQRTFLKPPLWRKWLLLFNHLLPQRTPGMKNTVLFESTSWRLS